ncbi:MAG: divalent-cation tolerance protein CutA [Geminicoccaceae bacterium]|nr:divalent-cation tolerance protein CutA [Geminicoccaceae bacterium]MCS7266442.1 divalent-cation tolerance protein CutA [Geminicoccaceae bacterium]MCX7630325.1 divalent-cation tolerance protein CutA [Geminicoccaceae bacterium]
MDLRLCYVTCASPGEAERIGRALVEARLAACANVVPGATSIYHWQGRIETAQETILVLKTRAELVEPLVAAVKERHSYSVPCVIALPIREGNPDYLAWLAAETASGGSGEPADKEDN